MISKSRFSLIAVIMLVLLGFGFQNQAKGVPGDDGQFCPFVEVPIGWLKTNDITPLSPLNFSGALIGTVEGVNGAAVGGMDWQHVDFVDPLAPTPTNEVGAQAVTWWTQKGGRNTFVQVTNSDEIPIAVHVRLLDENCNEIRNFCDFYTGGDTHVYDFGDLVTNIGDTPDDNVLQGHEGFLTITTVNDCPSPDQAFADNSLAVTVQVIDDIDYSYGFNANHRFAVCDDIPVFTDINLILNGSFQDGSLTSWFISQGGAAGVINESGISPNVDVPPCQGPDCDDPDASLFMSYIVSDLTVPAGPYGATSSPGSIAAQIRANAGFPNVDNLIQAGPADTNVTIVQSNEFFPGDDPQFFSNDGVVNYDLAFLAPDDVTWSSCENYAAVCLIDTTPTHQTIPAPPVVVDCDCYQQSGTANVGSITGGGTCSLQANDNATYAISPFEFQGGIGPFVSGSVGGVLVGNSYVVQYITAQKAGGCSTNPTNNTRSTTGALVDNFRNVETLRTFLECDGTLTGEINAFLTNFLPSQFAGQFNKIGDNEAGGDAVLINFSDEYLPNYRTIGQFVTAEIGIVDEFEDFQSCGDVTACFLRLGIDASIGISDEFNTPTPTGGPVTSPPPVTPTVPPTISPTNRPGGGGSCAIAGSPVQLGTAFANVLIPLVPVAFAFGVRAARRRRNK
jgi:hypothetical protein